MVIILPKQINIIYNGKEKNQGSLYQGCHPAVYGYKVAFDLAPVIVDCDNEWDWQQGPVECGQGDLPLPEGFIVIKWKIEDGDKPNLYDLFTIGKTISMFIRKGSDVLVHCAAGQNRSAMVAAVALFYLYGQTLSGEQIYRMIKEANPMALTNYSFRNIVQSLEQHYVVYGT